MQLPLIFLSASLYDKRSQSSFLWSYPLKEGLKGRVIIFSSLFYPLLIIFKLKVLLDLVFLFSSFLVFFFCVKDRKRKRPEGSLKQKEETQKMRQRLLDNSE